MGYRHYLAIIEKENFKKLNSEFIEQQKDEDGCLIICDLLKVLGAEEVHELGKYSKEGSKLETKKTEIPQDLKEAFDSVKRHCENHEYGFNLLTKEDLIEVINSYKERTINYLEDLLKEKDYKNEFDERTREQRIIEYIQDKLRWKEYYTDIKQENKYSVQGTWCYEYTIFDLIHILKTIDWNKYLLLIYGW